MGKYWVVKNSGRKATYLHREPVRDDSASNVVALLKNGQLLSGEFMHVRRASRETGFVKVKHMEPQCGSTWRVRNADGSPTTLLRKQPQEPHDAGNAVGYAAEGELLDSEFLFVLRLNEKRGGHVRWKYIKATRAPLVAAPSTTEEAEVAVVAAKPPLCRLEGQQWAVLDSGHDGAWLRTEPRSDRSQQNVVCLVRNGDTVVGELVHVRRKNGQEGLMKFQDLEQLPAKAWRVRNAGGFAKTPLWRMPLEQLDAANTVAYATEREQVEGEFVFVIRKDGKRKGYMKRQYLAALA